METQYSNIRFGDRTWAIWSFLVCVSEKLDFTLSLVREVHDKAFWGFPVGSGPVGVGYRAS